MRSSAPPKDKYPVAVSSGTGFTSVGTRWEYWSRRESRCRSPQTSTRSI
jgi:hypothetical protein